jgi:hypothetical protein
LSKPFRMAPCDDLKNSLGNICARLHLIIIVITFYRPIIKVFLVERKDVDKSVPFLVWLQCIIGPLWTFPTVDGWFVSISTVS